MITKITFSNYKAFDYATIDIRPINVFLGANSIGKSSILQLLLMLQQTALSPNYKSPLRLNGSYVSLGECINLLKGKDPNKKLKFELEIDKETKDVQFFFSNIIETYFKPIIIVTLGICNNKDIYNRIGYKRDIDFFFDDSAEVFRRISKSLFLSLVSDAIRNLNELNEKNNEMVVQYYPFTKMDYRAVIIENLKRGKISEFETVYDFFWNLLNQREHNLSFACELEYMDKALFLTEYTIYSDKKALLRINIDINRERDIEFYSDFVKLDDINSQYKQEINRIYQKNRTIFSFITDYLPEKSVNVFIYRNIIDKFNNIIKSELVDNALSHISPLRAFPKRYYFLDKSRNNQDVADSSDGDVIAEILNGNNAVLTKVNNWFKTFGLRLDVFQVKDVIHNLRVQQKEVLLDITDVGFGVSQILPIIIQGFLSKTNSITLIEQPEIHLHPKMQADLADLFIGFIQNKNKQAYKKIIVETHSEYLLKRLRRRISSNEIPSSDVAIYLFEPLEFGTNIRRLIVSDTGNFEWPKNFYEGDLLDDTIEFLKNQE